MADSEGDFVVVVGRRSAKRISAGSVCSRKKNEGLRSPDRDIDFEKLLLKLDEVKSALTGSEYVVKLLETVDRAAVVAGWRDAREVQDVVCYGLGNVSVHKIVKYQLAVLLILREHLGCQVRVYDPVFRPEEVEFLESLGLEVLRENEEGKRRIDHPALIYFPHCVKQLTNNFLYANWGPGLRNCVLFTNSFARVLESQAPNALKNTAEYIVRIRPYTEEFKLADCSGYQHAFYDSAIHVFSPQRLSSVPPGFWEDRNEPKYLEADAELVENRKSPAER